MAFDRQKILELITPVVEAMGYSLWYIDIHSANQQKILLRVYIDTLEDMRQGITLDDCEQVSRQLSALFDAENALVPTSYTLEVSSCGIDRSLFILKHYQRYINRMIKVCLFNRYSGQKSFVGKLVAAGEDGIKLLFNGEFIEFKLSDVSKAKLISEPIGKGI